MDQSQYPKYPQPTFTSNLRMNSFLGIRMLAVVLLAIASSTQAAPAPAPEGCAAVARDIDIHADGEQSVPGSVDPTADYDSQERPVA